ncbi:hypothetical protein H2201_003812 [Coniosporium apollinis]|uniref:Orc1-like AAA ATPase domain-containing protein n=1 Tax=Coniosporium apollinis TaxID=61459 RepID=A0ABQ9NUP6_9PEZI|nr:hypothetical protein H2201_003812 [Coniosporium apollinis]
MLPDELLTILNDQYPCRELQLRQLAALYAPSLPSPSAVVAHGLEATGKSSIIKSFLKSSNIPHAIIDSRECITGRHLLERTASCVDAYQNFGDGEANTPLYSRTENISALAVHLQRLLEGAGRFVLVFDGIDRQREAPPTLLPALARFGEIISNLSIIFIVQVPSPRLLHSPGVPHIFFAPYTRDQAIKILSTDPPSIFLEPPSPSAEYTDDLAAEDNAWLWTRFLGVVWDSLAKGAARDIVSFRSVATKLWRPFVQPIVDGTFGTRDFSRLMVHRRTLFQSEVALLDGIIPKDPVSTATARSTAKAITHDLPYYSKYLLCAAYLASYNPARQDPIYFMKATDKRRRKRGGGTALSRSKNRKIPRHLLTPSPFPLERLLAIFRAIVPHAVPQSADIYTQIATLASLRLLLRSGVGGGDALDASCKWRVNFGWDFVTGLGRSVGFEVAEFLAGGGE